MHTALRLGVRAAERIRNLNPGCFICFYGLYALLNADYLLAGVADAVIGGEFEGPLVALVDRLEREGMATTGRVAALDRLRFPRPPPPRPPPPPRSRPLPTPGPAVP